MKHKAPLSDPMGGHQDGGSRPRPRASAGGSGPTEGETDQRDRPVGRADLRRSPPIAVDGVNRTGPESLVLPSARRWCGPRRAWRVERSPAPRLPCYFTTFWPRKCSPLATLVVVLVGSVREVRPLEDVALRRLLLVVVLAVAGVKLVLLRLGICCGGMTSIG